MTQKGESVATMGGVQKKDASEDAALRSPPPGCSALRVCGPSAFARTIQGGVGEEKPVGGSLVDTFRGLGRACLCRGRKDSSF